MLCGVNEVVWNAQRRLALARGEAGGRLTARSCLLANDLSTGEMWSEIEEIRERNAVGKAIGRVIASYRGEASINVKIVAS